MGVVYAAYDPELDRKLAIKLMRSETWLDAAGSDGKSRLLREAQALARLSHPNVVALYDVGTLGEEIFIAMEYVEGCTLRQWLAAEGRHWREILRVFALAGKGISAAHGAGIVHRDFKPDNVMVAKNGRVCVLDFGLARRPDGARRPVPAEDQQIPPDAKTRAGALGIWMTKTGAFMGTPAYMSPEQLEGQPVDARSDQFSFSSALYEAICGEAPFQAETVRDRLSAIKAGRVNEPRKSSRAPAWLRQRLLRGLKPNPEDRYPSMDALLAALERDPTRRRWRIAAIGGIAALIGATASTSYELARRRSQVCMGAHQKLAGIWDERQKSLVTTTFRATQKPYAEDALRGVNRILDDYAQRWAAMQTDACEATRLRGEQSEELLDLRMACLSHRLEELRSLTGLLAKADDKLVVKSINAAQGLSDIDDCARVEILKSPMKAPPDPAIRAKVEELRGKLASAKVLHDTGKYSEAITLTTAAVAAAESLHYRPVQAEALFQLGLSQGQNMDYRGAEKNLTEAVLLAESTRHDVIAARAWSRLVWVGATAAKYDQAALWGRLATASIERLENEKLLAGVLNGLGIAAKEQGKYDEALNYLRRSLTLAEQANDYRDLSNALNNLGVVLRKQGKYSEALPYYQRALRLKEETLGPAHPELANTINNLGSLMRDQEKYDEALSYFNRALEIKERALGTAHPSLAIELHNIAEVLVHQQMPAQALPMFERALALHEKAFGLEHPNLIFHLTGIGNAQLGLKMPERAIPPLERALAISEKGKGEPSVVGEARFALARALTGVRRDPNRATSLGEAARQAFITAGAGSQKQLEELDHWLARKR
jgi:tetratricopeptide (TPR) repeat protein